MLMMTVRSASDAPIPNRATKAVREAQMQYEEYVQTINTDVGELELSPDEQPRSVKVRLRRAATRLGREIDIWDANGRIYFRVSSKRGRPKKSAP